MIPKSVKRFSEKIMLKQREHACHPACEADTERKKENDE